MVLVAAAVTACTAGRQAAAPAAAPASSPSTPLAAAVTTPTPVTTTPPTTAPLTAAARPAAAGCRHAGHVAVIDRARQRAWLCDGPYREGDELRVTTAISQPDPGTYPVYAKVRMTTSTFGGHLSYLDRFVAFSYGWRTGARIAFHAVPRSGKGLPFQPLDTLGDLNRRGESSRAASGCTPTTPSTSGTGCRSATRSS